MGESRVIDARIELGYRDRNVHELVVHELAERLGEYDRRGIEVVAVADQAAPLSAGLGGSAVERLLDRRRWIVRQVHTVRPLFWLWGSRGTRIATHPEGSIPWRFTGRILERVGMLATERVPFPAGPAADLARLDALLEGTVDAAVVGSSVAPSLARRLGLSELAYFGDILAVPTVGIAVDAALIDPHDAAVEAVVEAQASALEALRARDARAVDVVLTLLPRGTRDDAVAYLDEYLAVGYDVTPGNAAEAAADFVDWLARELEVEPVADLYDLA
jgi:hypothetical protein